MTKRDDILVRNRNIQLLLQCEGWKILKDFLTQQEVRLMNKMRNGKRETIDEARGGLKIIDLIKKFLKVELLQGEQLLQEMDSMLSDSQY